MQRAFNGVYRGRKVLVTGHTGFKGSWLALWLDQLGADVHGFSLPAPTEPSHFALLAPELQISSEQGDIRDAEHLARYVRVTQPEIVFHLAAQPLVRRSYAAPLETYATNVMGTLHLYEACRAAGSVRAIVSITTDKVYENLEQTAGYREFDPLGGHDPYSASKACADIATASYRRSFWPSQQYGETHATLVCTARAGNVIGGGDWAEDRLVPDLARAAARGEEAVLRNPESVRPWQHVLEPLTAYLLLGQRLYEGRAELARAWNFGPMQEGVMTVEQVARALAASWPALRYRVERPVDAPHEAGLLTLDCTLARRVLEWTPVWDGAPSFEHTAAWYRTHQEQGLTLSRVQLQAYVAAARLRGLPWTGDAP